jgi:hypothetical protein
MSTRQDLGRSAAEGRPQMASSRRLLTTLMTVALVLTVLAPTASGATEAIRTNSEFNTTALPANDDGSTGLVDIGFPVDFFGTTRTQLYVNNNGNVTFDSALAAYTPFNLLTTNRQIIAPFFADVDTRGVGSGLTRYGQGTVDGRPAFGVNWIDVGYYSQKVNKRNSFQLVLIDRSDTGPGNFDIEFNYSKIEWETGDAFSSGGTNGLGGNSARAGWSNGSTAAQELSGSAVNRAFLDANLTTGLIHNSLNSNVLGRYVFNVREGIPEPVDQTPPSCQVDALLSGPPAQLRVRTQDLESGIASIQVTRQTNLTVAIGPFTPGTTDPVMVTGTKIDNSKRAQLELRVTDVAGNQTVCDPVHTLEVRATGQPVTNVYDEIPEEEGTITIDNNTPGLQRLDVEVNGTLWKVTGLKDGQSRTLDVSSAMQPGDDNVVKLTAHGRPGGSADVWIWDGIN